MQLATHGDLNHDFPDVRWPVYWLVVWNMAFIFPNQIGDDDPIWRAYFSEGLKPPTSLYIYIFILWYLKIELQQMEDHDLPIEHGGFP